MGLFEGVRRAEVERGAHCRLSSDEEGQQDAASKRDMHLD
jgi:hypothetical protein